ncbi:Shedu immune nuclease family protein [Pedobacter sp. SAFR-022]|uniref:Shedu immune nuclease family protein n=1 Tax=Pedobacter sp. SAFR-022 TaxID=3436861 RepID=UPI003F7F3463
MTIRIYPFDDLLILKYTPDNNSGWVRDKLRDDGEFALKKTFLFKVKDLLDEAEQNKIEKAIENNDEWMETDEDDEPLDQDSIAFVLGHLTDDYYHIKPGKVTTDHSVFMHKDNKFDPKLFISARNISVFARMEKYMQRDILIGGNAEDAIPEPVMWDLIRKFPNTRQKDLYEGSIISGIIRDYVDNIPDYRAKYENYLNKQRTVKPSDLAPLVKNQEVHKFQLILDKLEMMLAHQKTYTEHQWQEEILTMITLIYPKYIHVYKSVPVKRKGHTDLQVDLLLIDSGGYADIIEIKKPTDSMIVTHGRYRDNHIPYRELSGTIMQIEKYIYYLNRWGPDGEQYLSRKLTGLPLGFEVKLTNPGGLLIMGRDDTLTQDQLKDFEVIKRKYKNIVDILTYDELIRRLKFTITLWTAKPGLNNC